MTRLLRAMPGGGRHEVLSAWWAAVPKRPASVSGTRSPEPAPHAPRVEDVEGSLGISEVGTVSPSLSNGGAL